MDKPFKTIAEQIAILESRGMRADDDAALVLASEGYYSVVNGYKDPLVDKRASAKAGHDVYKPGTTFGELRRLHSFDRDLRLTMFRYFSIAEAALKTACAYRFSQAHTQEREPYLDKGNYRSDGNYSRWVEKMIADFNTALGRNPGKRPADKAYIKHYAAEHDEVPLWVLMQHLTLGQTFKFYDFQRESMRNDIARHFSELYAQTHDKPVTVSQRRLRLAYDHIKDFRNICAHGERLYCARVSPSKSVSISDAIADLGLVLPKDEDSRMVREVGALLLNILNDLTTVNPRAILDAMGISSIEGAFFIRE